MPQDASGPTAASVAFWSQGGRAIAPQREKLKTQLEELYTTTFNLANYVEHNRTGFRKILKKHDKLTSVGAGRDRVSIACCQAVYHHNTLRPPCQHPAASSV